VRGTRDIRDKGDLVIEEQVADMLDGLPVICDPDVIVFDSELCRTDGKGAARHVISNGSRRKETPFDLQIPLSLPPIERKDARVSFG